MSLRKKIYQLIRMIPPFENVYSFLVLMRARKKWKRENRHNSTSMGCMFPISQVTVGKYSYGTINVKYYGNVNPEIRLEIGNFVSMADDILFLLNEKHKTDSFTTFPLKSILQKRAYSQDAQSRGSIVVEDHVWIGVRCTILSGVRIGKGSIIGAASVVTRDVPPYSVVMGNPARVVKMRFPQEIISILDAVELDKFDESGILGCIDDLYKEIRTVEDAVRLKEFLSSI